MKYEISDIITLNDNIDYTIVSIANYQNNTYALLCNINDIKHVMYVKIIDDRVITLGRNETTLINELNKLFFDNFREFLKNYEN